MLSETDVKCICLYSSISIPMRNITFKVLYFTLFSSYGILSPYIPLYFECLYFTKSEIGILSMIPNISLFFVSPAVNFFSYTMNANYEVIVLSLILSTLSTACMSLASNFSYILSITLIYSITKSPLQSQLDALIMTMLVNSSEAVPPKDDNLSTIQSIPNNDESRYGDIRKWGALSFGIFSFIGGLLVTIHNNEVRLRYNHLLLGPSPSTSSATESTSTESSSTESSSITDVMYANSNMQYNFRWIFFIYVVLALAAGFIILLIIYQEMLEQKILQRNRQKMIKMVSVNSTTSPMNHMLSNGLVEDPFQINKDRYRNGKQSTEDETDADGGEIEAGVGLEEEEEEEEEGMYIDNLVELETSNFINKSNMKSTNDIEMTRSSPSDRKDRKHRKTTLSSNHPCSLTDPDHRTLPSHDPLPIPTPHTSICSMLSEVISKHPNVLLFAIIVFLSGCGTGVIDAFLFLRLKELGSSSVIMGLCRLVSCIAEIPTFQVTGFLQKRYGTWSVLFITQIAFVLRFGFYSIGTVPVTFIPVESLHGVTFAMLWSVSCSYGNEIAPLGCEATMQSLLEGVHFGFGCGLGALLGGYCYDRLGAVALFQICTVMAMVSTGLAFVASRTLSNGSEQNQGYRTVNVEDSSSSKKQTGSMDP